MVASTLVSFQKISKMASVYLCGLTENNMRACGKMVSKTEKEYLKIVKVKKEKENGKTERELDGLEGQ